MPHTASSHEAKKHSLSPSLPNKTTATHLQSPSLQAQLDLLHWCTPSSQAFNTAPPPPLGVPAPLLLPRRMRLPPGLLPRLPAELAAETRARAGGKGLPAGVMSSPPARGGRGLWLPFMLAGQVARGRSFTTSNFTVTRGASPRSPARAVLRPLQQGQQDVGGFHVHVDSQHIDFDGQHSRANGRHCTHGCTWPCLVLLH